jgi:hypothetical protein
VEEVGAESEEVRMSVKGMRYVFSDGLREHIVEFTHTQDSLQPEAAWVAAHYRAHEKAVTENQPGRAIRVEDFDSDTPVHRDYFKTA